MSDNSGGDDGSSGLSVSDRTSIAALTISIIALLGVLFQGIQVVQGLPTSNKSVLGLWAKSVKWRFKWFRIEVRYEAPVIFLAPSDNKRWPVKGGKEWVVTGTNSQETRNDEPPIDNKLVPGTQNQRESVSTVKNEEASWIRVLIAAQKMERDSKTWEREKRRLGQTPPGVVSLAICLQPNERSFDDHPTIKKPYATTTIGHLVELCAVLGIYWKTFDQDADKYRAEGNGYTVVGSRVNDFGLIFTFEKPGWPRFWNNRVIPTAEVKELCFGNVPTLFRAVAEDQTWDSHWAVGMIEQSPDRLKTLQLGSRREIGDTLSLIGCNEKTIQYYTESTRQHVHLFPCKFPHSRTNHQPHTNQLTAVIFEVLGMLSRTLHIRDRPFTYLPNPVIFPLNKQTFSLPRLLTQFQNRLNEEIKHAKYPIPEDIQMIQSTADQLVLDLAQQPQPGNEQARRLHPSDLGYDPDVLNALHAAIDKVDAILTRVVKNVVLDVLRRHVQEVLQAINTTKDEAAAEGSTSAHNTPISRSNTINTISTLTPDIVREERISLDSLLDVAQENRERELMTKYFDEIRLRAVSLASSHHDPAAVEASLAIHEEEAEGAVNHMPQLQHHGASAASDPGQRTAMPEQIPEGQEVGAPGAGAGAGAVHSATTGNPPPPTRRSTAQIIRLTRSQTWWLSPPPPQDVVRNTVWCALVFRMICWLILHDFDKKDVQLSKSELMGSRLSVFIL
jgi:hypothetical protein